MDKEADIISNSNNSSKASFQIMSDVHFKGEWVPVEEMTLESPGENSNGTRTWADCLPEVLAGNELDYENGPLWFVKWIKQEIATEKEEEEEEEKEKEKERVVKENKHSYVLVFVSSHIMSDGKAGHNLIANQIIPLLQGDVKTVEKSSEIFTFTEDSQITKIIEEKTEKIDGDRETTSNTERDAKANAQDETAHNRNSSLKNCSDKKGDRVGVANVEDSPNNNNNNDLERMYFSKSLEEAVYDFKDAKLALHNRSVPLLFRGVTNAFIMKQRISRRFTSAGQNQQFPTENYFKKFTIDEKATAALISISKSREISVHSMLMVLVHRALHDARVKFQLNLNTDVVLYPIDARKFRSDLSNARTMPLGDYHKMGEHKMRPIREDLASKEGKAGFFKMAAEVRAGISVHNQPVQEKSLFDCCFHLLQKRNLTLQSFNALPGPCVFSNLGRNETIVKPCPSNNSNSNNNNSNSNSDSNNPFNNDNSDTISNRNNSCNNHRKQVSLRSHYFTLRTCSGTFVSVNTCNGKMHWILSYGSSVHEKGAGGLIADSLRDFIYLVANEYN